MRDPPSCDHHIYIYMCVHTSVISQMNGWKWKTSQVSYGNRIESWNEPDIGNKMFQSNAHSISIIGHPSPTLLPLLTTFSFSVMPMTQTTQSYRNYAGESHSILRNFNDETPFSVRRRHNNTGVRRANEVADDIQAEAP